MKQPDSVATLTAANDTLLRILAEHKQAGQVSPDALAKVRETAAALERIQPNAGPTLAATVADLAAKLRALEQLITGATHLKVQKYDA